MAAPRLQVAVDLGADVIFAVNPSRLDLETAGSFASAGISAITARSLTEILINEVSSDDARPSPPRAGQCRGSSLSSRTSTCTTSPRSTRA